MNDVYHVIPVDDFWEHEESEGCMCKPRIEENGKLIVHNSYDGREIIEEAERIINEPKT